MPRNMSFSLTTNQFKTQTKTVTRRLGWWFLKNGDLVNGVEKAMGLKKGEKMNKLCMIKIISTRKEPLSAITQDDVIKEGFPNWTPDLFVHFLCHKHGIGPDTLVNRIEFEYVF